MSFIKIKLATDENNDVDIHINVECSPRELEVATAALMNALVQQPGGQEALGDLVASLEEAYKEEADGTSED